MGIVLENGSKLLLEDGSALLTEVTPSAPNNAFRISGPQDVLQLATLPGSFPFTYTGWGYLSSDRNYICNFFSVEGSGSDYIQLATRLDGTTLALFDGSGERQAIGSMTVGTWYRMAIVVTSGSVSTYFGTESGSLTKQTTSCTTFATVTYSGIGGSSAGDSEWVDGRMAHSRVWNAALSDAEIEAEFRSNAPVRTSDLLGAWFPREITSGTVLTAVAGADLIDGSGSGTPDYTVEAGPLFAQDVVAPLIASGSQTLAPNVVQPALNNALRIDSFQDVLQLSTRSNAVNVTMLGWARIAVDRNTYSGIFSIESGLGSSTQWNELITDADGTTLVVYDHVSPTPVVTLGTMTVDTWYRVAMVITTGAVAAYMGPEGTSTLTKVTGSISNISTNDYQGIGSTNASTSEWFNGRLAGVRVWNAALSDAEIEAEFQSYTPVRSTNLLGAWLPPDVLAGTVTTAISGANLTAGNGATSPSYTIEAGPIVVQTVKPGLFSNPTTLYTPYVLQPSAQTITASLFTNSNTFYSPTVANSGTQTIVAPFTALTNGFPVADDPFRGPVIPIKPGVMPHISLGKPVYGTGSYAKMFDNGYGYTSVTPGAWAATAGDWVAINLGAGPSQILIALSNDQAALTSGSYLSTEMSAYRIQVSNNSTNGSDGTWTTVITETSNPSMNREYLVSFTGYSWVKLICDTLTGGQLDEMDIWDATASLNNTFAFLGDSLTVRSTQRDTYFGGGRRPSFQDKFLTNTGSYPLQLNVGTVGQNAAGWATNISSVLSLYPDVKYWCIGIGTNDGANMPSQIGTWRTNMQTIIDAILAAGRIPVLTRVPWTGSATYGGGSFTTSGLAYLNDNGIEWLFTQYGGSLRRGPDLYKLMYDNQVAYATTSDPHWNDDGVIAWANAWANSFGTTTEQGLVQSSSIASTATTYAPTVSNLNTILPGLFSAGSAPFAPTVVQAGGTATLSPPLLGSTENVFAPAVQNANALSAPQIASTSQTFAPNVVPVVAPGLLASASQTFAPSVRNLNTLTVGLLASASQAFAPSIVGVVAPPQIAATSQIFAPSVSQTVATPALGPSSQLFAPSLTNLNTLVASLLASGSQLFAPTVAQFSQLSPPLLGPSSQLFGPTITTANSLQASLLGPGSQLYAPTVAQFSLVAPPQIASTAQTFAPSLTTANALQAPLLASSAQTFGPSVVRIVQPPAIATTAQTFAPVVLPGGVVLVAPLLGSAAQLFAPSVAAGASTLVPPQIASTAQTFVPSVKQNVATPALGPNSQLYAPTVKGANTLQTSRIESAEIVFAPAVVRVVGPPQIASTAQVFAPSLTLSTTISPARLESAEVVFAPAVVTDNGIAVPLFVNGSTTFAPSVVAVIKPSLLTSGQIDTPTVIGSLGWSAIPRPVTPMPLRPGNWRSYWHDKG